MASTVANLRSEIATRLLTIAPTTVTRQSEEPYLFVRNAPHSPVHGEFAVGVASTAPIDPDRRQRPGDGEHVETMVDVGFWWQLEKERNQAFDDMLVAETTVRNTLIALGWTTNFHLTWRESTRTAGIDGWVWANQTFRAIHRLPLA